MATALTEQGWTKHDTEATDDPFHDPLMIGIGIVVFVVALIILGLTGLFYWGVEIRTPPWNANSFPPPIVH